MGDACVLGCEQGGGLYFAGLIVLFWRAWRTSYMFRSALYAWETDEKYTDGYTDGHTDGGRACAEVPRDPGTANSSEKFTGS